jgi:hypothetical protein
LNVVLLALVLSIGCRQRWGVVEILSRFEGLKVGSRFKVASLTESCIYQHNKLKSLRDEDASAILFLSAFQMKLSHQPTK